MLCGKSRVAEQCLDGDTLRVAREKLLLKGKRFAVLAVTDQALLACKEPIGGVGNLLDEGIGLRTGGSCSDALPLLIKAAG